MLREADLFSRLLARFAIFSGQGSAAFLNDSLVEATSFSNEPRLQAYSSWLIAEALNKSLLQRRLSGIRHRRPMPFSC